jgi:hypothetical protein
VLARARLRLDRAKILSWRDAPPPQFGKESSAIGSIGLADERPERRLHEGAGLLVERLRQILTQHDYPHPAVDHVEIALFPEKSEVAPSRRVNLAKLLGRVYRQPREILANSAEIVFELRLVISSRGAAVGDCGACDGVNPQARPDRHR